MDLEHRIAKLERQLRLARLAVAALACAAIWSSCKTSDPGPATALKAGTLRIDSDGIRFDAPLALISLTESGLDIQAKKDTRHITIDEKRISVREDHSVLIAEPQQLRLETGGRDFPRTTASLETREGYAGLTVKDQINDANTNGTGLEATADRAGSVEHSSHPSK